MKNFYKLCVALVLCAAPNAFGQIDFENFDYSTGNLTTVSGGIWTAYSDGGSNPVQVTSPGLSYTGYPGSGVGNAATVGGGGGAQEDVERPFTQQCSGTIYTSFLINVSSTIPQADKLVFSFRDNTNQNFGKVFVLKDGQNRLQFGLSKTALSADQRTNNATYNFGETYLIVLKYYYLGGTNNDEVSLFIYGDNTIPSTEGAPDISSNDNFDAGCLDAIALIQDGNGGTAIIDGIRVGTSFNDAPLPVELMNFNISSAENKSFLQWTTGSEVDNAGFEVYRSEKGNIVANPSFKKVGSYTVNNELRGLGSSATGKTYSFTDGDASLREGATYVYKIVDVSLDGGRVEHEAKEVMIQSTDAVTPTSEDPRFTSAWPNPATDNVTVSFFVQDEAVLNAEVYNSAGFKVLSPIVNKNYMSGDYTENFSTASLPAGVYTIRITGETSFDVSKFTVVR